MAKHRTELGKRARMMRSKRRVEKLRHRTKVALLAYSALKNRLDEAEEVFTADYRAWSYDAHGGEYGNVTASDLTLKGRVAQATSNAVGLPNPNLHLVH